jgi:ribose 5-phosphate isomerase B
MLGVMRVHIGTDHAGFEAKAQITAWLQGQGHDVTDHGPHAYDALDDYPAFCLAVGVAVVNDPGSLGVVLGGSGNGEQIAANKVEGVRAALAWNVATAQLAREHNDANVVSIGARMHEPAEVLRILDAFLETPFSGEERHVRRISQISAYEQRAAPRPAAPA